MSLTKEVGKMRGWEMRDFKLKPCPFCGGEAELIQSGKKFSVRCKEISCENHTALFSHWTIPVGRWNRRYKGDKE